MRIIIPPDLAKIGDEIRPYYDFTQKDHFRPDTPDEIRKKAAYFREKSEELYKEAERAEGLPV